MKNVLLIGVVITGLVCGPLTYGATKITDNFNDTLMDTTLWKYYNDGTSESVLYEANGVLNFTSAGSVNDSYKAYGSLWTYDLTYDFSIKADFHFDYNGIGETAIGFGLYNKWDVGMYPEYSVYEDARSTEGESNFRMIITDADDNALWEKKTPGNITTGSVEMNYDSLNDTIHFDMFDINDTNVASAEYAGLSNLDTSWKVFIYGFTVDGAALTEGMANIDNFEATPVPEPVSSALFLAGSVLLTVLNRRKQVHRS